MDNESINQVSFCFEETDSTMSEFDTDEWSVYSEDEEEL